MIGLPINPSHKSNQRGFSLVELAIVLVIVALLSGGLLLGLSGQREQILNKEAQEQLAQIRDSLLGFAMSAGRLPCPANPALTIQNGGGNEALICAPADCSGDKTCALEHGVVPWQTLGLKETDPWGNRFTYFAGREYSNPLLQSEMDQGMRTRFTLDTNGRANIQDGAGNNIASAIPAVIVSHGTRSTGAYQPTGAQLPGAAGDEAENADADLTFIAHTPTDNFDDLVTWIIPTVLKSRMVAVGKLP